MPNFSKLDEKSERQVQFLRTFYRKRREFQLRKHIAEAALQIAEAIVPKLRDENASDVRIKGRLLNRSSAACIRLAQYPGALRFCDFRVKKAAEWLKTKGIL